MRDECATKQEELLGEIGRAANELSTLLNAYQRNHGMMEELYDASDILRTLDSLIQQAHEEFYKCDSARDHIDSMYDIQLQFALRDMLRR